MPSPHHQAQMRQMRQDRAQELREARQTTEERSYQLPKRPPVTSAELASQLEEAVSKNDRSQAQEIISTLVRDGELSKVSTALAKTMGQGKRKTVRAVVAHYREELQNAGLSEGRQEHIMKTLGSTAIGAALHQRGNSELSMLERSDLQGDVQAIADATGISSQERDKVVARHIKAVCENPRRDVLERSAVVDDLVRTFDVRDNVQLRMQVQPSLDKLSQERTSTGLRQIEELVKENGSQALPSSFDRELRSIQQQYGLDEGSTKFIAKTAVHSLVVDAIKRRAPETEMNGLRELVSSAEREIGVKIPDAARDIDRAMLKREYMQPIQVIDAQQEQENLRQLIVSNQPEGLRDSISRLAASGNFDNVGAALIDSFASGEVSRETMRTAMREFVTIAQAHPNGPSSKELVEGIQQIGQRAIEYNLKANSQELANGLPSDVKRNAQNIADVTGISREELSETLKPFEQRERVQRLRPAGRRSFGPAHSRSR